MDTTLAPPSFASSGKISGVGFAHANTIASFAMVCTISFVSLPGADTPMNTSAPFTTSANVPFSFCGFVIFAIAAFALFRPSRPS